jgi:hypothetical protein
VHEIQKLKGKIRQKNKSPKNFRDLSGIKKYNV